MEVFWNVQLKTCVPTKAVALCGKRCARFPALLPSQEYTVGLFSIRRHKNPARPCRVLLENSLKHHDIARMRRLCRALRRIESWHSGPIHG